MLSQSAATHSESGASKAGVERDGQHDFDFELGSWKIHLKRLEPVTSRADPPTVALQSPTSLADSLTE